MVIEVKQEMTEESTKSGKFSNLEIMSLNIKEYSEKIRK